MVIKPTKKVPDVVSQNPGASLSIVRCFLAVLAMVFLGLYSARVTSTTFAWFPWVVLSWAAMATMAQVHFFTILQARPFFSAGPEQFIVGLLKLGLVMGIFLFFLATSLLATLQLILLIKYKYFFIALIFLIYILVLLATKRSVILATLVSPVIMLLVYSWGIKSFTSPTDYISLDMLINTYNFPWAKEATEWLLILTRYCNYALGNLATNTHSTSLIVYAISHVIIFFSFSSLLGFCLLPLRTVAHHLGAMSLGEGELAPGSPPAMMGMGVYLMAMLLLVVFIHFTWRDQLKNTTSPEAESLSYIADLRQYLQELESPLAVSIDGQLFNAQILKERDKAYQQKVKSDQVILNELAGEWDDIFNSYLKNVDAYMAWYDKLPAQSDKIFSPDAAKRAKFLSSTLDEYLLRGVNFGRINMFRERYENIKLEYDRKIQCLLDNYQLSSWSVGAPVSAAMTKFEYFYLIDGSMDNFIGFKAHQNAQIFSGVAPKALPLRVVEKLKSKDVFQIAQGTRAGKEGLEHVTLQKAILDSIAEQRQWLILKMAALGNTTR